MDFIWSVIPIALPNGQGCQGDRAIPLGERKQCMGSRESRDGRVRMTISKVTPVQREVAEAKRDCWARSETFVLKRAAWFQVWDSVHLLCRSESL